MVPGEDNLAYLKELIKRYEAGLRAIKKAEDPADVTKQERLIQPVLKEMQLVTPRVWNDFVQAGRARRKEIREGI